MILCLRRTLRLLKLFSAAEILAELLRENSFVLWIDAAAFQNTGSNAFNPSAAAAS